MSDIFWGVFGLTLSVVGMILLWGSIGWMIAMCVAIGLNVMTICRGLSDL
jgi:hypothetical protein